MNETGTRRKGILIRRGAGIRKEKGEGRSKGATETRIYQNKCNRGTREKNSIRGQVALCQPLERRKKTAGKAIRNCRTFRGGG